MARSLQINKSNLTVHGTLDTNQNVLSFLQLNNSKALGLAMFVVSDAYNVSFSNLHMDGYNNATKSIHDLNGVAYVNVTYGVMNNILLRNFRNGVYVNVSTVVHIRNTTIQTSQYDGVLVRNSSDVVFNHSVSTLNGRYGIAFNGNSKSLMVSFSKIASHMLDGNCGVRFEQAQGVYLGNNTIINNDIGVCLKEIVKLTLINNVIYSGNGTKCVYITNAVNTQFVNNDCNAKIIDPTTPLPAKNAEHDIPPVEKTPPRQHKSDSIQTSMSCVVMLLTMKLSILMLLCM
jgi:hypothetical protein